MKDTGRRESKSSTRVIGVRARRAERTREQILRAGLKVFSEKGVQGATMEDIALELEATKGLLYYHFKTKEEILSAILKQSPVVAALQDRVSSANTLPFAQAVPSAIDGVLEILEEHRDFIRFLHVQAMLSGKEAEVVYNEVVNRMTQTVAAGVEMFKSRGEVRSDTDSMHWATMIVRLVMSYFIENQVFGQSHQLGTDYLAYITDSLIASITVKRLSGKEGK